MHLTVHGKERTNHCVLKRYVEKKKTIVMGSQLKTIVMGSQPKTREICRPWDVSLVN